MKISVIKAALRNKEEALFSAVVWGLSTNKPAHPYVYCMIFPHSDFLFTVQINVLLIPLSAGDGRKAENSRLKICVVCWEGVGDRQSAGTRKRMSLWPPG